jgi:hypothetical protein
MIFRQVFLRLNFPHFWFYPPSQSQKRYVKKDKLQNRHISTFGKVKIKKSKIWKSRFQEDLTSNSNLFSEFLSFHYINRCVGNRTCLFVLDKDRKSPLLQLTYEDFFNYTSHNFKYHQSFV